jgi:uncharacterized protein GlcG (DUF336 family)
VVRQQVTLPNVIAISGGLPIKAGGEIIGGAGASGSPRVDEPCVQAGLDKALDQLKQGSGGATVRNKCRMFCQPTKTF